MDDHPVNRTILKKALEGTYTCVEAENGMEALKLLKDQYDSVSAIVLDMVMPVMDGYEVLRALSKDGRFSSIPVLAITEKTNGGEAEKNCLRLGAWDFISKPIDSQLLKMRLRNMIGRSRLYSANRTNAMAESDQLTGLYNRAKFFKDTREYINRAQEPLVMLRFDVDKFRMYNSYFGEEEGDRLLRYIADGLRAIASQLPSCVYGRIEADVFAVCMPYEEKSICTITDSIVSRLKKYKATYYIEPSIGIYPITDRNMSAEAMYTCASLAAEQCKNRYMTYVAYYDPKMSQQIIQSQEIMNEAQQALEEQQFVVYLQPKYNIRTNQPYGAEALVRWKHPARGMISPGSFIPVFEANGFIGKLDYYMWEHVCQLLHKWIDAGLKPAPISVNVSRANLYNPDFADLISHLVEQYQLPVEMLNLEITESAYMENPKMMIHAVKELQRRGFVIMMDDFGSGYSSLNTLKDIPVDVLKIDMNFLRNGSEDGRGERILASITRMAGWLDLPVIVEGVETREQRDFLESIGCGYIQGYYYAKPMPVSDYESLLADPTMAQIPAETHVSDSHMIDAIWSASSEIEETFESVQSPLAVYEYANGAISLMRVNHPFTEMFGVAGPKEDFTDFFRKSVLEEDLADMKYTFERAVRQKEAAECEFLLLGIREKNRYIRMKLQGVQHTGTTAAVLASFTDVTAQNALKEELRRLYENAPAQYTQILIVDDSEVSRSVLGEMFRRSYRVLEAGDGQEAQKILRREKGNVAVILLDMIMPVMDGETFLHWKQTEPSVADIPVVVISAQQSEDAQLQMLQLGVNDYVTKPFVPEMVVRRVNNVLEYNSRFHKILEEYRQKENNA
ncbi:MAG: EAL domain-containing protein [Faecalibacterium sp.]|nr:EAL domain-containing protein [Faecalibacterium sp.]